jgi:hypothetical protein
VVQPWSNHRQDKDKLRVEQVGGSHLFLDDVYVFEMIYLWWYIIKSLLKDETMMKCLIELWMIVEMTMKCWSILHECWNNDENVNVLK